MTNKTVIEMYDGKNYKDRYAYIDADSSVRMTGRDDKFQNAHITRGKVPGATPNGQKRDDIGYQCHPVDGSAPSFMLLSPKGLAAMAKLWEEAAAQSRKQIAIGNARQAELARAEKVKQYGESFVAEEEDEIRAFGGKSKRSVWSREPYHKGEFDE